MAEELFHIRDAREDDLGYCTSYAFAEGMGGIDSTENLRVAVDDIDEVVGFLRLTFDEVGVAHVNPVVTYPTWRGVGVGRALVEDALETQGELRLVSRGSSLTFYEALGFVPVDWADIRGEIVAECDECELFDECGPVPLGKKLQRPSEGVD